jgi:hypothetical protein
MRIPFAIILIAFFQFLPVPRSTSQTLSEKGQANSVLLIVTAQKQVTCSASELKSLPHITLNVKNVHTDAQETYSGVRVADLLAKLGASLEKEMQGKAMANYVLAVGSDGYKVIFLIAEIDPDFHPGEIIVADEMNGKPLDSNSGPFKLVATEDKRPARWVRNLVSLELKSPDQ